MFSKYYYLQLVQVMHFFFFFGRRAPLLAKVSNRVGMLFLNLVTQSLVIDL